MCDLCGYTGRYYLGEGDDAPCMFCKDDVGHLVPIVNALYTADWDEKHQMGAYQIKHDIETVFGKYVSTETAIQTCLFARLPSDREDHPTFYLKPKFQLGWLWNRVTTRPKGARKAEWEAYQRVLELKANPPSPVVSLRADLPAGEEGSLETQSPAPVHSSPQDD